MDCYISVKFISIQNNLLDIENILYTKLNLLHHLTCYLLLVLNYSNVYRFYIISKDTVYFTIHES